jgi:hypothetical protein
MTGALRDSSLEQRVVPSPRPVGPSGGPGRLCDPRLACFMLWDSIGRIWGILIP